jgi:hypothetical protein
LSTGKVTFCFLNTTTTTTTTTLKQSMAVALSEHDKKRECSKE